MSSEKSKTYKTGISIETIKIPTESNKGTPNKGDNICSFWVFQNCGGEKEKKLRRIVSLVRNRNAIDWLPVTTDGKVCIVTFLGDFNNLIKLRSSVFGLGMESYSFISNKFWITAPQDLSQFQRFFNIVQSDLQSKEKRLLQQREIEIKSKSIEISPSDFGEADDVDLTEADIDDLRKELDAISSL